MKAKPISMAAAVTVLALCLGYGFGYYAGYHKGQLNEQRAWESTAQVYQAASNAPVVYANPHEPEVVVSGPSQNPMNQPDPRTSLVK